MVVRKPVRGLLAGSLGEAAARAPITQERAKGPLQARSERHPLPPRHMAPQRHRAMPIPRHCSLAPGRRYGTLVSASERRLEGFPAQSNGRANCRAYPPFKVRAKGPPNQLNQART